MLHFESRTHRRIEFLHLLHCLTQICGGRACGPHRTAESRIRPEERGGAWCHRQACSQHPQLLAASCWLSILPTS